MPLNDTIENTIFTDSEKLQNNSLVTAKSIHVNELKNALSTLENALINVDNCGNCIAECSNKECTTDKQCNACSQCNACTQCNGCSQCNGCNQCFSSGTRGLLSVRQCNVISNSYNNVNAWAPYYDQCISIYSSYSTYTKCQYQCA